MSAYPAGARPLTLIVILAGLLGSAPARAQDSAGAREQIPPGHERPAPLVTAVRVNPGVRLDGVLDEEVWQRAAAATDFRQQQPNEGESASQRTEIRFAFDDDALYIGARMYDQLGAEGVRTRLARRDSDVDGDHVQFVFDTFHDHAGRTIFRVNPSGVKYDAGQAAPSVDPSWDPVWEVATRTDSLGWTAEIRIPWSQLRYPAREEQMWGLQVWRYVERLNEISMWSFWGLQETGGPPFFGHLAGLQVPVRRLGAEILPYAVGRAAYEQPRQAGSPLESSSDYGMRVGADLKALLGSSVTIDATVNPDFGQVEVDPAVVNLSVFETFFQERRPFFVEGSGLFGFGGLNCFFCSNVQSLGLFYSRRIGRSPQGFVTEPAEYTSSPTSTTILGAAKVTARTPGGLQVGVMNALTGSAKGEGIRADGSRFREEVEPLTNYAVARLRRTFHDGNVAVGLIGTSVARSFGNAALADLLPARAEAVGADWRVWWGQRRYNFMGSIALSQVSGSEAALLRLQHSPARYYQRPDRSTRSRGIWTDAYDSTHNALRGLGGYARVAKDAGTWLWEAAVNFRTPGFEVNDLAFLTRADYVWMNANIGRTWTVPTSWYRALHVMAGTQQQYNFDGDRTDRQLHGFAGMQTTSYWWLNTFLILRPESLDDRLTRGGPVVARAASWFWAANLNTDSRRRVVLSGGSSFGGSAEGAFSYTANLNVRYKPASNLTVSIGPSFSHSESTTQFVRRFSDDTATGFHGQRIVFADLAQKTLAMETRLSAAFTPTLTLDVFVQPLVAAADYSRLKEFDGERTTAKTVYDEAQLEVVRDASGRDSLYVLSPTGDPGTTFEFDNPDFNFRSLRGNAVLRWEWRPGSTLFVVWQQERSGSEPFGDFRLGRDVGGLLDPRANHVFLVKATYWLGR